ncbi:S-layer homology domain-containing protein [Cohnella pontilimi]|uniref:S-layer homology domain-containing protein n=1 Tax=Cohnella pontilimi TaxID=2564100 RepID=A0A4U0FAY5_9BACL|nr:S-layer homology domain-containing protein [Cohnella pontilimi]TJY41925.1 S-layer homology domain-containing protein [Cohnella pontilimi]
MRESSYKSSMQDKQMFSRGGEKKVMKKSLSVLLAGALAFGSFASLAAAAEKTTLDKFNELKALQIFSGVNANGDAGLDQKMTRAEFAVIVAKLAGLSQETSTSFTDSQTHWGKGWIGAVEKAGLIAGVGNNKFAPNATVKIEEMVIVLDKALKIAPSTGATVPGTDAWATQWVDAALKAGLISAETDYTVAALRSKLVDAAYQAHSLINTPAELKVAKASQMGAKKITVEFNRALTAAEEAALKVEAKNGLVPYAATTTVAADKKSATLTFTFLPAADYDVKVNDLDAVKVSVADEKVAKLEIKNGSIFVANDQPVNIVATNQFGEEMDKSGLGLSVTVVAKGTTLTPDGSGNYDFVTAGVAKDDIVVVTVTHPATGVSTTKSFKATDASLVTAVTVGPVAPLTGKSRITTGDDALVLPYTLKDAAGNSYTLPAIDSVSGNTVFFGADKAYQLIVSNTHIADPASFALDADGKLTFSVDGASPAESGTLVLTLLNVQAGTSANTTVKVEDAQKVGKFQLAGPGVLAAKNEDVKFNFTAIDNFGAPIAQSEFAKTATNSQITFTTSRGADLTVTPKWNYKGELSLNFTNAGVPNPTGSTIVFAWINNTTLASQVTIDLKDTAVPTKVVANKDLAANYGIGGKDSVDLDSIKVVDNYGREMTNLGSADLVVNVKDASTDVVTIGTDADGNPEVRGMAAGSKTLVIGLDLGGGTTIDAGTSIEVPVTVLADDKITSYSIKDPGLFYAKDTNDSTHYNKALTLEGKTSGGAKVAINQTRYFTGVTSSDTSIFDTNGANAWSIAKGEATLSFLNGATKLADIKVTSSDAKPVVKTIEVANAEEDITGNVADIAATYLTVKDQYGAAAVAPKLYFSSSDTAVLTVSATGALTAVADGTATVTIVSSNGVVATIVFTVDV